MKELFKIQKGITLIALVITIIVLLILAGVSITMLTGENGILTQANKAKENMEQATKNEIAMLNSIEDYLSEQAGESYSKEKGVNRPQILAGMHEVMFKLPEGNNKGEVIEKGQQRFDENDWYNYKESKWANARTQDGSYWVWIPRYAYKITYNDVNNKSKGGSIDVKFLVGTTDQYYDENGQLKTAKRATSATEIVDTTTDYYVHPAFTDESKINYANGGWDKELTGIWVAKFEAGFASGNNEVPVQKSSINYTHSIVSTTPTEAGATTEQRVPARNWLDGIYGGKETAISYPTFQPMTYSMNYITLNDVYNLSKILTEANNIYGFASNTTDSHLMKNSEWGAVVYLGYSQYGSKGEEPYLNNINLNSGNRKRTETAGKSGVDSIYAVTGVTTATSDAEEKITTIENINGTVGNTANDSIYTWNQIEGQKASVTLNMYGVYDMNGGAWERTANYIANGSSSLKDFAIDFAYDGNKLKTTSTKYVTVYPFDVEQDNSSINATDENISKAMRANYEKNKYIFGDAIRETSINGWESAWNGDRSNYSFLTSPFVERGGSYRAKKEAGPFYFDQTSGHGPYGGGFRATLVQK